MVAGILLEGVTGAGKSQTLRALHAHPAFPALLGAGRTFDEDETLGEFMDELRDPTPTPPERLVRLHRVLDALRRGAARATGGRYGYVLERFHPSYYALLPDWSLYQGIDRALTELNCRIVLLGFDPNQAQRRALERVDRSDTTWLAEMVEHYGSRDAALEAVTLSQRRRRECLALSKLPCIEINTTAMDWPAYAEQIVAYWQAIPEEAREDSPC